MLGRARARRLEPVAGAPDGGWKGIVSVAENVFSAKEARSRLDSLQANIEQIIKGKSQIVRMAIVGLLARGHVLFEDVPGVGKTTLAQCLARSISLSFQRIQGTSDLLPSDILGVMVYDSAHQAFTFRAGPIFANLVLMDEINRASPKTQSALLEAMNTAQVSIERHTYDLPRPFMVIATQNPVDSYGTFPLPHSQLDRFALRLHLGYPDADHERQILRNQRDIGDLSVVGAILSGEELLAMQAGTRGVLVEDSLVHYVVEIVDATRHSAMVEVGGSTRAALAMRNCAQAHAYMEGRDYAIPDDVKMVAASVLAHRLELTRAFEEDADAMGNGAAIVQDILERIPVPV
jgi:MoxR-like ATPase